MTRAIPHTSCTCPTSAPGATGPGTHRNYYDGGQYAYLDTAPDDTFSNQPSYFRTLVNGNMIVDCSDPTNPKQVSHSWVPGSKQCEAAEYNKWTWSKPDETPFVGLHGPVYVPTKLENGRPRLRRVRMQRLHHPRLVGSQ